MTDVRVHRLQEISEEDAKAEGYMNDWESYRSAYLRLWESINGQGAWDANPYVWAITFRRLEGGMK